MSTEAPLEPRDQETTITGALNLHGSGTRWSPQDSCFLDTC